MEVFFPSYYHEFRCIAAACPDSCCKEWAVQIDEESADRYRALEGALGDDLRAFLQEEDGDTILALTPDGRCPMWRADGLCRIHAQLGEDWLCHTCREFPRLRHDYGDFVELGLELSCPEAARLILRNGEPGMLVCTQPGGTEPEYDATAMATLRRSRKAALDFLNSDRPVPEALAAILLYAHDIQSELDGADPSGLSPADCVRSFACQGDMNAVFVFFQGLEILTPLWKTRLQESPKPVVWSPVLRALARYMIERYWLQTISDYDLICRVKFMIVACLLVGAMGADPIETAQLFSKEIENDLDNVEAILDAAYSAPALTDANLLGLLSDEN